MSSIIEISSNERLPHYVSEKIYKMLLQLVDGCKYYSVGSQFSDERKYFSYSSTNIGATIEGEAAEEVYFKFIKKYYDNKTRRNRRSSPPL